MDEPELHQAMAFGLTLNQPCAIRYPRDNVPAPLPACPPFELGRSRKLRDGDDATILCYGVTSTYALAAADLLAEQGLDVSVVNARFAKPIDEDMVRDAFASGAPVVTAEDHSIAGGFGSVLGMLPELGYEQRRCAFGPGDLLVVFSDGVTEAESPEEEEYGDERLATWLGSLLTRPAADLITGILEEVDRFTDGAPAGDDVTLVIARYPEKT